MTQVGKVAGQSPFLQTRRWTRWFTCVSSTPVRLCLVAAVLSLCAGKASADVVSKITAFAGDTVILPCHITPSDDFPTVEWSKEGLSPNVILLYRDGCETFEMKHPDFQYRTNLMMKELKNGNFSLRISDLQLSDEGKYQCMMLWKKQQQVITTLELVVGAVSEPKLSAVPGVGDGVTLQCEAKCWSPEPTLTFLDDQGKEISAENPKTASDSRGCFTVTRRATVHTAGNWITCRVHQPQMKQTRDAEIYIPVVTSCSLPIGITVAVTLFISGCIITAITCFFCKRYHYSVIGQKLVVSEQPPVQGITCSNAGTYRPNNEADLVNAELRREIGELKSNLHHKDEIIHQLTQGLNDLKSRQQPVVQQGRYTIESQSLPDVSPTGNLPQQQFPHDNSTKPAASTNSSPPKSGNSPQDNDSEPGASRQIPAHMPRPHIKRSSHGSSPALSTNNGAAPSSSSASTSEKKHVFRSRSLSESRPRPGAAKPQRRYTTSGMSNNPFNVLADLHEEDSEPLI